MPPHEEGPREGAYSTSGRAGHHQDTRDGDGDPERAPIGALMRAFGQTYPGGPAICPTRCRRLPRWPDPAPRRGSLFVQDATTARCFTCGTTFTLWRLRSIVLGDAALVKQLERELAVTS